MQHRLVVLGSLGEFVELVKMAKARGYYTIVCDGYDFGPAKKFADKAYTINIRDTDAVAKMCIEEKADGIIGSFSDLLFEMITEIAAKANLRWYATPDMLPYYRMKNVAKQAFDKLGIHSAKSCTLKEDFQDAELADFHFPVVIKPINGYGSKGIYIVRSIEEIRDRYQDVIIRSASDVDEIAVEEYIHGKEYNMMTWLTDGKINVISIADREKNPQEEDRIPLCNRIVYPAEDVAGVIGQATEVLSKFAAFTGQKNGALSMQFFYWQGEVYVCEIAGRLFGYEHELVTYGSGLSIEKLLLDYVYEEETLKADLAKHSPYYPHCCAVLYFTGKHGMKIKSQQTAIDLKSEPHVLDNNTFYQEGDIIDNYGPNPYFARYYIDADSREELDEVTKEFFAKMKVEGEDGQEVTYRCLLNKEGN